LEALEIIGGLDDANAVEHLVQRRTISLRDAPVQRLRRHREVRPRVSRAARCAKTTVANGLSLASNFA